MILNKIGYSYGDITMIPSIISDIESRSECNPFIEGNKLPIFTAPMSTIVNEKNIGIWESNGITPIIPRNISYENRCEYCQKGKWVAFSLKEFKEIFVEPYNNYYDDDFVNPHFDSNEYKICIDLANGHMRSLYYAINKAKYFANKNNYKLIIMTGNIANPETYEWICEHSEVDYIRLNIGGGFNCLTASNVSTHYPIATLIEECFKIKEKYYNIGNTPEIIADGGIRGYSDVIKSLGLGADYAMIGSLFTGLLESAAPLIIESYNSNYKYSFKEDGTVNNGISDILSIWGDADEVYKRDFIHDMKSITKESYGMSTKKAQMLIDPNAKTKTSEGCTKYIQVKETVHQWVDNMISYLKSAMSYTNKKTIEEFKGNVNFIINSSCSILSVNK